jgi:hypothetical protein
VVSGQCSRKRPPPIESALQFIPHDPCGFPHPHIDECTCPPAALAPAEAPDAPTATTDSFRPVFFDPHAGHFTLASRWLIVIICSNVASH